jgi:hypothetical protein
MLRTASVFLFTSLVNASLEVALSSAVRYLYHLLSLDFFALVSLL